MDILKCTHPCSDQLPFTLTAKKPTAFPKCHVHITTGVIHPAVPGEGQQEDTRIPAAPGFQLVLKTRKGKEAFTDMFISHEGDSRAHPQAAASLRALNQHPAPLTRLFLQMQHVPNTSSSTSPPISAAHACQTHSWCSCSLKTTLALSTHPQLALAAS